MKNHCLIVHVLLLVYCCIVESKIRTYECKELIGHKVICNFTGQANKELEIWSHDDESITILDVIGASSVNLKPDADLKNLTEVRIFNSRRITLNYSSTNRNMKIIIENSNASVIDLSNMYFKFTKGSISESLKMADMREFDIEEASINILKGSSAMFSPSISNSTIEKLDLNINGNALLKIKNSNINYLDNLTYESNNMSSIITCTRFGNLKKNIFVMRKGMIRIKNSTFESYEPMFIMIEGGELVLDNSAKSLSSNAVGMISEGSLNLEIEEKERNYSILIETDTKGDHSEIFSPLERVSLVPGYNYPVLFSILGVLSFLVVVAFIVFVIVIYKNRREDEKQEHNIGKSNIDMKQVGNQITESKPSSDYIINLDFEKRNEVTDNKNLSNTEDAHRNSDDLPHRANNPLKLNIYPPRDINHHQHDNDVDQENYEEPDFDDAEEIKDDIGIYAENDLSTIKPPINKQLWENVNLDVNRSKVDKPSPPPRLPSQYGKNPKTSNTYVSKGERSPFLEKQREMTGLNIDNIQKANGEGDGEDVLGIYVDNNDNGLGIYADGDPNVELGTYEEPDIEVNCSANDELEGYAENDIVDEKVQNLASNSFDQEMYADVDAPFPNVNKTKQKLLQMKFDVKPPSNEKEKPAIPPRAQGFKWK